MLTRPISGGRLVFRCVAVVACAEVGPPLRVLVFCEIAVITVSIRHFLDLVALFAQNDELFLRSFRGAFRFVEAGEGLPMILDTT